MPAKKKKRFDPEPILEFSGDASHLRECGRDGAHDFPIRTCILEREGKEKPYLLRFVLSPEGEVVPDIKGKLPGRGVWLTARKNALEEAIRRRLFHRAFKKVVEVRQDLPAKVEDLLKRSAIETLSLANKAGLVVTGFVKVGESIKRGEIIALLHADTAAAHGKTKLDSIFAASSSGKDHRVPKNCFTVAEISLATGSANVIHAGFKDGGASRAFIRAVERFSDYRAAE